MYKKPDESYEYLLRRANIIKDGDIIVNNEINNIKKENTIFLMQVFYNKEVVLTKKDKIKYIITMNPSILNELKNDFKTILIPFPLKEEFKNQVDFEKRFDAMYYHGRIIPGKLPLKLLKILAEAKINIIIQGPICKEYWEYIDLEKEEFLDYKKRLFELIYNFDNITYIRETRSLEEINFLLNKYKFYFTLSHGEAFNIALQEAIQTGAIPIVFNNEAYYWAKDLYLGVNNVEEMINYYFKYKNSKNAAEYSKLISKRIQERWSDEELYKLFLQQLNEKEN